MGKAAVIMGFQKCPKFEQPYYVQLGFTSLTEKDETGLQVRTGNYLQVKSKTRL